MVSIASSLARGFGNTLVIADKVLDFIPYVSVVSNTVDVVARGVLSLMRSYTPSLYRKIENSPVVVHLNAKEVVVCVFLAIPYLNIFLACLRHLGKKDSQPSARANPYDHSIDSSLAALEEKLRQDTQQSYKAEAARQTQLATNKKMHIEKYEQQISEIDKQAAQYSSDTPEGIFRLKMIGIQRETLVSSLETARAIL